MLSIHATLGTTAWFCLVYGVSLVLDRNGFYGVTPDFEPVSVFAQIAAVCTFVVSVLNTYQRALDKLTLQQEELARREAEAAALILGSPDGVTVVSEDRSIRSINPALARLLGENSKVAISDPATNLAAEDSGREALNKLLNQGSGSAEFRLNTAAEEALIVSVNAQRLTALRLDRCVQLTLRNVTREHAEHEKRLELERRLRRSEKMEAFGQFAGGVAHDFNNLLTGVIGHAETVQRGLEREVIDRHENSETLQRLIETAGRGADITRGLLSFSRSDGGATRIDGDDPVLGAALDWVDETIALLRAEEEAQVGHPAGRAPGGSPNAGSWHDLGR